MVEQSLFNLKTNCLICLNFIFSWNDSFHRETLYKLKQYILTEFQPKNYAREQNFHNLYKLQNHKTVIASRETCNVQEGF